MTKKKYFHSPVFDFFKAAEKKDIAAATLIFNRYVASLKKTFKLTPAEAFLSATNNVGYLSNDALPTRKWGDYYIKLREGNATWGPNNVKELVTALGCVEAQDKQSTAHKAYIAVAKDMKIIP